MKDAIRYQFLVQADRESVFSAVEEAAGMIGKIKELNEPAGVICFSAKPSSTAFPIKFDINIVGKGEETFVSAFTKAGGGAFDSTHADKVWGDFLVPFIERVGEHVPELSAAKPYILRAEYVGGKTTQVTNGVAQGASIGRALIGGALFGEAGAIVGGLSGNRRSMNTSQEVFSDYGLFTVYFSNGRVREMKVKKRSKEYNEIMAKLI